jgi:hypothetical protein
VINLEKAKKILGVECEQLTDEQLADILSFFYLLANIKYNHKNFPDEEESSNHVQSE